ncbi:DUF3077 domain-containing protein [Pseudomonas sp.]|uniref:DUF3077 domain-containing protein n=1 Tax=Pseudomonas sp. TaxID=306 RepID=UPI0028AF3E61|nr:DUF3077 domain-containing protein [Pseudomonas sp.]
MSDEPPLNVTLGIRQFSETGKSAAAMFQVSPGVPFGEAYEHVSVLLGYIHHLVAEGDAQDDHKLLGAAGYLSAFAKAIVDDIEIAQNERLSLTRL